jgi:hypothetical protein
MIKKICIGIVVFILSLQCVYAEVIRDGRHYAIQWQTLQNIGFSKKKASNTVVEALRDIGMSERNIKITLQDMISCIKKKCHQS